MIVLWGEPWVGQEWAQDDSWEGMAVVYKIDDGSGPCYPMWSPPATRGDFNLKSHHISFVPQSH